MKKKLYTWILAGFAALLIHDVMLLGGCLLIHGNLSMESLKTLIWDRLTMPGDAQRYLQIAGEGYVTEGENVINLVFYPLYPLVIRVCSLGIFDLAGTGMVLSRLFLMGSGAALYELAKVDGDVIRRGR